MLCPEVEMKKICHDSEQHIQIGLVLSYVGQFPSQILGCLLSADSDPMPNVHNADLLVAISRPCLRVDSWWPREF